MRLDEIEIEGNLESKRDIIKKLFGKQAILCDRDSWMHVLLIDEYNREMYTVKDGNIGKPICLYYCDLQKLIVLYPSNGNSLPEIH